MLQDLFAFAVRFSGALPRDSRPQSPGGRAIGKAASSLQAPCLIVSNAKSPGPGRALERKTPARSEPESEPPRPAGPMPASATGSGNEAVPRSASGGQTRPNLNETRLLHWQAAGEPCY